jgi:hypothetical protein
MYYINNITSSGHRLVNYAENALSKIIPGEDRASGRIIRTVGEVSKGVFCGVAPHLINMSPLYLSSSTNLRILSSSLLGIKILHHTSPLAILPIANSLVAFMDLYDLIPLTPECRLAVDSLLILNTAIGSCQAMSEGMRQLASCWNSKKDRVAKISDFVSGGILTALGAIGMDTCVNKSLRTITGLIKLQEFDSQQTRLIFRHRAISSIGEKKLCKAVFLGNDFRYGTDPLNEELYKNCETRGYSVNSSSQFCEALDDARTAFGADINVVSLQGHGYSESLRLGENYRFRGKHTETNCLQKVLSPDAQVILAGCNTATPDTEETLTDHLSQSLPGKEIIGFASYYIPFFTTTSFSNGRFQHDNHYWRSTLGFVSPISTVVKKIFS